MHRRLRRLPTRAATCGATVHEATTLASRLLGLALLSDGDLPAGHALLITNCRSIHTFGMRFPIDVVFIDERGSILRVDRAVKPRRLLYCRTAFAVLETRAGEAGLFSRPSRPAAPTAGSAP